MTTPKKNCWQEGCNCIKCGETATDSVSAVADCYDIKHPTAMIVINNQAELNYICEWNEMHDVLPPWLGKRSEYPIAASPNDGGWTDHMDRALYYIPFVEFVKAVS